MTLTVGSLFSGIGGLELGLERAGWKVIWQAEALAVGAPHLRYRVFIVAHAIGPDPEGRRGEPDLRDGRPVPAAARREPPRGGGRSDLAYAESVTVRAGLCQGDEAGVWGRRSGDLSSQGGGRWSPEPDVGRVAHGVPSRVDRLRCLGNAVVPQVAEFVGRRLLEHVHSLDGQSGGDE